jgi:hypothetical protein
VILALAVVAFVSGKVPLALVAVGVALALWATGVLTLPRRSRASATPRCCSSRRCSS